ncbi:hypothetical protein F2Q69_00001620 [Brassica cretica]|uniref:Uncharacterized protein n=1 Tax=Brassica cretica TaxID=69181 RepID=A0A8S9PKM6_BRACR|nr:hypothetical protein F2Q69_00001620 [Brassica cretica]
MRNLTVKPVAIDSQLNQSTQRVGFIPKGARLRDYSDIKGDPKDAFLSAQTHKIQGEKKTSIHGQILHQLSLTTGTTPDSERRPEALGRVYNTRTFVHVHRGMDQVGGEKLEVGTTQRIRIRR